MNGIYNGIDNGNVNGIYHSINNGVGNGVVSNEGLIIKRFFLDQFPNATVAYSLRRLSIGYLGTPIRVRRSSDNAEQDIEFNIDGIVNEIQLRGFVGDGDGFVSVWYDQSGLGNHASQTSANQPRIVIGGVVNKQDGNMCINFATNKWLETQNILFPNNFSFILSAGIHQAGSADYFGSRAGISGDGWIYGVRTSTSYLLGNVGFANCTITFSTQLSKHIAYLSYIGTAQSLFINSTFSATNTSSISNASPLNVGRGGPQIANNFNGNMFELIGYRSDQAINRLRMERNANNYYKIY